MARFMFTDLFEEFGIDDTPAPACGYPEEALLSFTLGD
jgi:hypothetical protein